MKTMKNILKIFWIAMMVIGTLAAIEALRANIAWLVVLNLFMVFINLYFYEKQNTNEKINN